MDHPIHLLTRNYFHDLKTKWKLGMIDAEKARKGWAALPMGWFVLRWLDKADHPVYDDPNVMLKILKMEHPQ